MYIVRYRTHGPWQSEPCANWEAADHLSSSLAKTYSEVVVDLHIQAMRYRHGKLEAVDTRGIKK